MSRAALGRPRVLDLEARRRTSPGWAAARSPSPTARPRSPRCWPWASRPSASPAARSRASCPTAGGERVFDPTGVVKGWAVERAAAPPARRCDGTDFCLSAGGDLVCRTVRPDADPWRIGIEDPHDPTRLVARPSRCATARSRRPGPPTAGSAPGRRPHRARARGRRLGHRRGRLADLGRHRRHRGLRPWAPVQPTGCATRPGRTGVVVWADGTRARSSPGPASAGAVTR